MVDRPQIEEFGMRGLVVEHISDEVSVARQLDMFDMFLDMKDASVTPCCIRDGFWEAWITAWMVNTIPDGARCVDIGANMGYYALLMGKLAGEDGWVHAFEPQPKYASLMTLSFERNEIGNATVHPFAVSDKAGWINLAIPGDLKGSASIHQQSFDPKWGTQENLEVPMITLDEALDGAHVDFMKIDAEGAEPMIWRGMQRVLANSPDIVIAMEWDANNWGDEGSTQFYEELTSSMNLTKINTDGREEPVSREELTTSDGVWQMIVLRHK